jgi:glutamate racemase
MAVGIIDSGVGGLSIAREIKKILPDEPLVYLGDSARVPYGTRSSELIKQFARELVDFFKNKPIEVLVVACHTMSAVALGEIRSRARVPIIDVIGPTVSLIKKSNFKEVGLIGTRATVKQGAYERFLENSGIRLKTQEATLLVSLAEFGLIDTEITDRALYFYLNRMKPVEALILACTHFPPYQAQIKKFLPGVQLINPAKPTALALKELLKKKREDLSSFAEAMEDKYYFTDLAPSFQKTACTFLGRPLKAVKKVCL